jgi:hypothetical protein
MLQTSKGTRNPPQHEIVYMMDVKCFVAYRGQGTSMKTL